MGTNDAIVKTEKQDSIQFQDEKAHSIKKKVTNSFLYKRKQSEFSSFSTSTSNYYNQVEVSRLRKIAIRCASIVCVTAALDGCDEQLLPASLRALEVDLGISPKSLGNIILVQILCLALSCPIWGFLADRYSRKYILSIGVFFWGIVTMILSFSQYYWEVLVTRAINGAFLGSVGPIAQSVLADTLSSEHRGFGFGMIQLSNCIGRVFGAVLTTSISQELIAGYQGWRFAFLLVGTMSMILGVFIALFMSEIPHLHLRTRQSHSNNEISSDDSTTYSISVTRPHTGGVDSDVSLSDEISDQLLDSSSESSLTQDINIENNSALDFIKEVIFESLATKSVILLIVEGLFGTIPWSALTFMTLYLQYCNLSNFQSAIVIAAMLLGSMIGGPMGGIIGDYLNRRSENHGRPLIGQISMTLRIPLLCVLFLVVPKQEKSFGLFILCAFTMGLCAIAGAAVNRPILADVVRTSHRATVFSVTVLFEGISAAAFGAPVVGLLAENTFGYKFTSLNISEMTSSARVTNANALAHALLFLTVLPWSISLILYSLLHFTYGKDKINLKRRLFELVNISE